MMSIHRRRVGVGLAVLAAAALALGTASGASASSASSVSAARPATASARHAAVHPKTVMSKRGVRPHAAAGNLQYNGGPVETHPVVYLVFWGSQWNSDPNGVQSYLQNYFSGLGTSQDHWSPINSQYTDSSGAGPSFSGSVLGGTWVDNGSAAPSSATQQAIANEADSGAAHFGVSGPNADVFVVSPSGTSPDGFPNSGFCAWHSWSGTVAYTNMPYVLDAGSSCGANSVRSQLDGFSIVGGHEYAEAVTDPQPSSGWVDASGQEIGDLCAWQSLSTQSLPTGSFAIQPLWSNSTGGCTSTG